MCTSGYGEGIVIATGKNTVVGKTMLLTDALDKPQSEFHISLFKLIR
jgi:magnesium-transporting ATPase (P-type)